MSKFRASLNGDLWPADEIVYVEISDEEIRELTGVRPLTLTDFNKAIQDPAVEAEMLAKYWEKTDADDAYN